MRRITLTVASCLIAAFAFTGCGEGKNVQWVSQPGATCPSIDWDEIEANKDGVKEGMGGIICGASGKSYGGEWRCKNGLIEVRCE